MLRYIIVLAFFGASPALSAVHTGRAHSCSAGEFACGDGACVSQDRRCDGARDCADGGDEQFCASSSNKLDLHDIILNRDRRQAECRRNQYRCRDGSCINFDGKCDGVVDCPDGSDETHALCRNMRCQANLFRCTYGACVDGNAACNNQKDCADNSDELLPRCRNETEEIRGQFTCKSGAKIPAADHCDGVKNCDDGSDETIESCAGKRCASYLFQCAYGACVDAGADCDGKLDCADGSDESDELCNRTTIITTTTNKPSSSEGCRLPDYPDHGFYTVSYKPNAKPGEVYDMVFLDVTCAPGYGVDGSRNPHCIQGKWWTPMPQCTRYCKLAPHPSITYYCQVPDIISGTRICGEFEPSGTVVQPECNRPNYYYPGVLNYMRCIDGSWDSVAICQPECGTPTPEGEILIINGTSVKHGELPWHAGIYDKRTMPYMQICGGSLVTTTVVISAAHCFWNDVEHILPPSYYAVAVGKIYRPWNNPKDMGAQKSDVSGIKIPSRFAGVAANYQDDIALVILSRPMVLAIHVRPVCIDFDFGFDSRQLQPGNTGKVAGWGLTAEDGSPSQVLKATELPYVDIDKCIADLPYNFRSYITSDKICAGTLNGTSLCKGDSGGGLAFPQEERGVQRYYLRGVVSTAPSNGHKCNANSYTSFTQILKHDHFIRDYVNNNR